MNPCVFDSIVSGELPAHKVAEEGSLMAFLDSRPVFPGHTLVIPKKHVENLAALDDELGAEMFLLARRVAAAQRSALGSDGAFLAMNDVVSQSVPHVHIHVVPRRRKDGLRGFFWPRLKYEDDQQAAQIARGIRLALEDLEENRAAPPFST